MLCHLAGVTTFMSLEQGHLVLRSQFYLARDIAVVQAVEVRQSKIRQGMLERFQWRRAVHISNANPESTRSHNTLDSRRATVGVEGFVEVLLT